jgi:hypothetical protein
MNFGASLIFLAFASGIFGGLCLKQNYDLIFTKMLLAGTACSIALICGYYWGFQAFVVGSIISIIGYAIIHFKFKGIDGLYENNQTYQEESSLTANRIASGSKPYFAGPGTKLKIAGYELVDPLIYVADCKALDDFDASLLCIRRKIDPPRTDLNRSLPYWPQLCNFEPYQVGIYLYWLCSGRKDPDIELGYVFLYFYGLERRALVDGKDIIPIAKEVLRLLSIYNKSGSFRQYATGLIIHLVLLKKLKLTTQLINIIVKHQQGRVDERLQAMLLGYLAKTKSPLPTRLALQLAKQDERTIRSVILDRAYEEFARLFTIKYESKFRNIMRPKLGDKELVIGYHPASPSLLSGSLYSDIIAPARWPSVDGWKKQFDPVIKLYNECIEELRDYARKTKACSKDVPVAFEALPQELREEKKHPLQDRWDNLMAEFTPESRTWLLPVSKIAELRGIDYRSKLTLTQSKSIVTLVESLGASLEPNAIYTHKTYHWDEYVAVLWLPDQPSLPKSQNYALVGMLIPLAIEVSLANEILEDKERKVIIDFFHEKFVLSLNERLRMEALIDCLLKNTPSIGNVHYSISQRFNEEQRQTIGKFLVMIAGAADGICEEEIKALEKTFKSLVLDKNLIEKYIEELGYESLIERPKLAVKGQEDIGGEPIPPRRIALNIDKIRQIREDSIEAAEILLHAMEQTDVRVNVIEEDATDGYLNKQYANEQIRINTSILERLPEYIKPFFKEVTSRDQWLGSEIKELADKYSVTVSAAFEEINSWADENLGDLLIEEGEPVIINSELLKNIEDMA